MCGLLDRICSASCISVMLRDTVSGTEFLHILLPDTSAHATLFVLPLWNAACRWQEPEGLCTDVAAFQPQSSIRLNSQVSPLLVCPVSCDYDAHPNAPNAANAHRLAAAQPPLPAHRAIAAAPLGRRTKLRGGPPPPPKHRQQGRTPVQHGNRSEPSSGRRFVPARRNRDRPLSAASGLCQMLLCAGVETAQVGACAAAELGAACSTWFDSSW